MEFCLDRIKNIQEKKGKYEKNTLIDWSEYFEDIVGVTKTESAELEDITLRFLGKTGKYIESKPLHGSQKSKWINGSMLELKMKLIINYELEKLILSYSDSVAVIAHLSLKATVKSRLLAGLNQC